MEFKALHVHTLTGEVAANLERLLSGLVGVKQFSITMETQEIYILFDEKQIGFQTLAQKMATVGCSLHDIDAAVLM
jgi:hypothetical protein